MLIKPFVFDGDKSFLHVNRDFLQGNFDAVLFVIEPCHFISLAIINIRCHRGMEGAAVELRSIFNIRVDNGKCAGAQNNKSNK